MVAILDRPANENYSSRAAQRRPTASPTRTRRPNKDVFRRFHAALYAQQPSETGTAFPDNDAADRDRPPGRCRSATCPTASTSGTLRRHGRGPGRGHRHQRAPRRSGSTARTSQSPRPRPTTWSPRSRRSSATCPGLTAAPAAPRPSPPPAPRGAVTVAGADPARPAARGGGRAAAASRCGTRQRAVGADRRRRSGWPRRSR